MKLRGLALLLLIAPVALATADFSVVAFSSDKTVAQFGEPITLTARIANAGPDTANVAVHFNFGFGYILNVHAIPSSGICPGSFTANSAVVCSTSLAPGAQQVFVTTVLVYSRAGTEYEAVVVSSDDPVATNNRQTINVTRIASETQADLVVAATPAHTAAPRGEPARVRASVTNNGPSSVSKVYLLAFSDRMRDAVQVNAVYGSRWICGTHGPRSTCHLPSLAAGETSSVDIEFRSDRQAVSEFEFRAFAEKNDDPNLTNSRAVSRIGFGNATDYKMYLLPLDSEIVEGANGSRWYTDTTMLLRSETNVDVRPEICELVVLDCTVSEPVPLNEPFAFYALSPRTLGQYVYVPVADADKVNANTRTYDSSRSTSTGGAEIPFVAEDDFASGTTSLLGIPLEPDNRYTLRIYDAEGRGGRVLVHVYAQVPFDPPRSGNQEKKPRKTFAVNLLPGGLPHETTTTALLPVHPATAQINPIAGIDLAGVHRLRIDIEPLDQGLRLWSFVSITNNRTHHVTTVSQRK